MGLFKKKKEKFSSIKAINNLSNITFIKNKDYCTCELPIRMFRLTQENFKIWHCAKCEKEVNPNSKMINKNISYLNLFINEMTTNERLIQSKINEIIDLLKASGMMV